MKKLSLLFISCMVSMLAFGQSDSLEAWREAIAHTNEQAAGCFEATYPSMEWNKVECVEAPDIPFIPRTGAKSLTVGNGNDWVAQVTSGLISKTVGSFPKVMGVTSEEDDGVENSYSLQINSNFMHTRACDGAEVPAECMAWQQYVYDSDSAEAYMQYWLMNWNTAYTNGRINGNVDGWTINQGFVVSDTFRLTGAPTVTGFEFGAWLFPGDRLSSVQWSITSEPLGGGTVYGSGTANVTGTFLFTNAYNFNVENITATGLNVALNAGTYWLNLQNAVVAPHGGDPAYWDENKGGQLPGGGGCGGDNGMGGGCPSMAMQNNPRENIPSESFSIMGDNPCPGEWHSSGEDCWKNSAAVPVPKEVITQLETLQISGSAVSGGLDRLIMYVGEESYRTTGEDSVLYLATAWKESEFNVFGDGNGSEADFNTGSSITVKNQVSNGTTDAPICLSGLDATGTSGETNNLNLGSCIPEGGANPYIKFTESN